MKKFLYFPVQTFVFGVVLGAFMSSDVGLNKALLVVVIVSIITILFNELAERLNNV